MKLSPFAQMKLAAVLIAAYTLLGCEAPTSTAGEQTPPVYPVAVAPAPQPITPPPDLVTVNTAAPVQPAVLQPISGEQPLEQPEEAAPATTPVKLSDRLQEVVKLAQSGVGDDVILAFIKSATAPFSPTSDEILYLTDLGLSDVVITALVNHLANQAGVANQGGPGPVNPGPPPMAPPAGQPPNAEATYNPEPQVVYSEPPVVQYVTPPPTVEYNYFYSSLNPYGSWVEISDYGTCWQPTVAVVQRDWRPYCDRGRWLSTDCGWYWQSDYSWGWAPFHYGRWFNHPARGWCWRPDSVWAPAWVSWRYTDAYCGWAPLPPGARFHERSGFTYYGAHVGVSFGFGLHRDAWTFVPARRLHDREVWRYRASPVEHRAAFRNSTVVNNFVVNNNTIINHGVTPDHVRALPRTEVRKVAVRDLPERGGRALRPDRLQQEGAQMVVYRPKPLPTPQASTRPLESSAGRTVSSHYAAPARGGVGAVNSPGSVQAGGVGRAAELRPRTEAPVPDGAGSRPIRAIGSTSAAPTTRAPERATQPALSPSSARPSVSLDDLRARTAVRPTPSVGTPSQSIAPQTYRAPTTPRIASRVEPSRISTAPVPGAQTPAPSIPRVTPQSAPAVRQEQPAPAPTTYRLPTSASNPGRNQGRSWSPSPSPSFQRTTPAAPQPSSQPSTAFRQEPPKPITSIAPEKYNTYSAPSVQARRIESAPSFRTPSANSGFSLPAQGAYSAPQPSRPAPSYSPPPMQSRPAPSYSPPPMQSRPAPSYSAPVQSRAAQAPPSFSAPAVRSAPPQSAPAPNQTGRSGNRRQF